MSRRSAGFLALAIVLLFFFLVFLLWFLNYLTSPYYGTFETTPFTLAIIFLVPALVLLWLWRREVARIRQLRGLASAHDEQLRNLASILQTYNQIPLAEAAQRMGVSPQEVEGLTSAALAAGYAKGHVDRASGIFYPETPGSATQREVLTRERILIRCKFCGALVEQGETRCKSCGAVLG